MRSQKGSQFERQICKELSLWWSKEERDDIFWRSSQSGGRATQRSKRGLRTYGSYGDIAAVDPIGEPLLRLFTIELKRGSSYSTIGDLLDFEGREGNSRHPFSKCLLQAYKSHQQACSITWLLIHKRDFRMPLVYAPYDWLLAIVSKLHKVRSCRLHLKVSDKWFDIGVIKLSAFLSRTNPDEILKILQSPRLAGRWKVQDP